MPKALWLNWYLSMHKVFGKSRRERVRAAGLVACCNYFSKKKKFIFLIEFQPMSSASDNSSLSSDQNTNQFLV